MRLCVRSFPKKVSLTAVLLTRYPCDAHHIWCTIIHRDTRKKRLLLPLRNQMRIFIIELVTVTVCVPGVIPLYIGQAKGRQHQEKLLAATIAYRITHRPPRLCVVFFNSFPLCKRCQSWLRVQPLSVIRRPVLPQMRAWHIHYLIEIWETNPQMFHYH